MSSCKFISRKHDLHGGTAVSQSVWHSTTDLYLPNVVMVMRLLPDQLPRVRWRCLVLNKGNKKGRDHPLALIFRLGSPAVVCDPARVKKCLPPGERRAPQSPFQHKKTRRWWQMQQVIKECSVWKRFLSFRLLLAARLFWEFQPALILPRREGNIRLNMVPWPLNSSTNKRN